VTFEEIEAEALKLVPKARARLAMRLLESLEALSGPARDPRGFLRGIDTGVEREGDRE
jgi:hypothetical protein